MGEVWKARDTRLRRDVAIKTLPGALAREPGRLARLEREAELLAALNHHHVATIYGIERLADASFLVLELVEGETLEDRIERGAIPVEQALTLALQLAQALEAAHDKGIVHRDLKPSNIKITPQEQIKVLDFGIAIALTVADGDETAAIDPAGTGVVVGTPAYMSPEQARGESVGVQSDIWSFGAVLYEMLTGVSPFKRSTSAETLASVLAAQPDYPALPAETPGVARRLVQRCLAKDRSQRLKDMGDVRILVEEALTPSPSAGAGTTLRARRGSPWAAMALVVGALAGAVAWSLFNRPAPPAPIAPVYLAMPFAGRPYPVPFGSRPLAISPDASTVAFASTSGLQIRRMDQNDAVTIPTGFASNPFFSPDGEWVGVFLETTLIKVPVGGGTPVTIAGFTDRPAGGTWRADGTIIFATSEGLYEASANGGERKLIAKPARDRKETLYAFPQALPGSGSILFTVISEEPNDPRHVVLMDLKTLERRRLLQGSSARYVPGGYLVYVAGTTLNAVGFDAAVGALTGKPASLPDITTAVSADNGASNFAISDTGTLIFTAPAGESLRTLEWVDRRGRRETLQVEPQLYAYPRVSPDGTRVAVERTTADNRDIWILDLKRLTQTQLTDGPTEDMLPTWSPDGRRVFFASRRGGNFDLYSQAANGASAARLEFSGEETQAPTHVTPDGTKVIIYDRFNDLAIFEIGRPNRLEPLLHSNFDERLGQVSPDGRWIAYESDESGKRFEIVLRPFPKVNERRETLSVNGGRYPRWGAAGSNELYYVTPDGAMMAVTVTLSPALTLGATKKLFDWQRPVQGRSGLPYDVAPDGRFLMARLLAANPQTSTTVSVVLNWLEKARSQFGDEAPAVGQQR